MPGERTPLLMEGGRWRGVRLARSSVCVTSANVQATAGLTLLRFRSILSKGDQMQLAMQQKHMMPVVSKKELPSPISSLKPFENPVSKWLILDFVN